MSVIIIEDSYIYRNGENNPGWMMAAGRFDSDAGVFTMNWEAEDVFIDGLNLKLYICETKKTVWITKLGGKYIDISPRFDKDLALETFGDFHLKDEIMEIIGLVVKKVLGSSWKVAVYAKDLVTKENFPVLGMLCKVEELEPDVCHIIFRHVMGV